MAGQMQKCCGSSRNGAEDQLEFNSRSQMMESLANGTAAAFSKTVFALQWQTCPTDGRATPFCDFKGGDHICLPLARSRGRAKKAVVTYFDWTGRRKQFDKRGLEPRQ
jgi:hypothetical protein